MNKALSALVLLIGSSVPVLAEEPSAVSTESKTEQPQAADEASPGQPAATEPKAAQEKSSVEMPSAPATETQPAAEKNPISGEKDQTFTDRDGDGIQDGKEHRFRGKHRRGSRKGWVEDSGENGEKRHRAKGSGGQR